MNQPYLIWAAVFICFRLGHTLAPSGNWVPIVDAIRPRLLNPDDMLLLTKMKSSRPIILINLISCLNEH